jgi:hypothetical protein
MLPHTAAFLLLAIGLGVTALAAAPKSPTPSPSVCAFEENCACPAPGITARWEMQYCFGKIGTDDCESAFDCMNEMKKKFAKDLRGKSACAQNAFWRERYCKDFHADGLKACLADVPPFIARGC